jgi:hypothetical protein
MRTARPRSWRAEAAALAVGAAAYATSGCVDKRCDPTSGAYGAAAGEGALVDANTWETTPARDVPWLFFGPERLWTFDLRSLAGPRDVVNVEPYVSESEHPWESGQNFAVAGGNLAEFRIAEPGVLEVRNNTCATYYLRLVVELAPATAATDAGAD